MADTKVLVVDDSLTMRALISRVLDTLPGIKVVGAADGAAEARTEIAKLKPDVLTLDVEMPGMSGIEYLAELMASDKPLPVIMFSTKTEAGASSSVEALRLGAIDCFPKPKAASQAEFDAVLSKLGKRIKTAKLTAVKPGRSQRIGAFDWNGRMLVIGTETSGVSRLFDLIGSFPANCPPTLVVLHAGADLVASMIEQLDAASAPKVVAAENAGTPQQGHVYVSRPGAAHIGVDQWPGGSIRMMTRDPVAGERPSISIALMLQARAAAAEAIGVMLTEAGEDGATGIDAILKAGGHMIAPAALLGGGKGEYVLKRGDVAQPIGWDDFAVQLMKLCAK